MISGSQSVTQKSFRMNSDNENVLAQMITYECNVLSEKNAFLEKPTAMYYFLLFFLSFLFIIINNIDRMAN